MTSCNTILRNLLIILPFGDTDIVSRAVEIQLYQIQITTSYAVLPQTYTFTYIFIFSYTETPAQLFRKWWSYLVICLGLGVHLLCIFTTNVFKPPYPLLPLPSP